MKRRFVLVPLAVIAGGLAVALTVLLAIPAPATVPADAVPAGVGSAVEVAIPGTVGQDASVAVAMMDSDELLLEQRADFARPIASITKIITALVVLEAAPLDEGEDGPVFTPGDAEQQTFADLYRSGSAVLPVSPDAPLTERQLLQAMLVASSANHAFMLAFQTFGDIEGYRQAVQSWLLQRGFTATSIIDPAGVSELDRSTAREMLAIGKLALANPTIAETVAMPEVEVPGAGTHPNRNLLLGTDGVDGIKTGTTGDAGFSLMVSASVDVGAGAQHVLAIVLGADSNTGRYATTLELLGEVRKGFAEVELPAGSVVGTYDPEWGPPVDAVLAESLRALAWRGEVFSELAPTDPAVAGSIVGHLSWLAPTGRQAADVVLTSELAGPDIGWRLFGRWA
jgi:D-alanyl-D-alanine carboxypeptidase (penicillin-binding protein 5/6)